MIRDNESGLHKIGMTTDWGRRSRELHVGRGSTAVSLMPCNDALRWEKVLHAQFKHRRLPQSEWFRVTEEEAVAKMQWLTQQLIVAREQSRYVVGRWQQAQAGHYYRRRKSANGHWYTETKTAGQVEEDRQRYMLSRAEMAERQVTREVRREPGYWPVSGSSELQWQEKDPSLLAERRSSLIMIGGILAVLIGLASPGAGLTIALVTALAVLCAR